MPVPPLLSSLPARPPAPARPGAVLAGRDLRFALTLHLFAYGPLTVTRLVTLLLEAGWTLRGRPSKEVSDALRWEVGRGRVVRLGRGRYGPGVVSRTTARRIRLHTVALAAGGPPS